MYKTPLFFHISSSSVIPRYLNASANFTINVFLPRRGRPKQSLSIYRSRAYIQFRRSVTTVANPPWPWLLPLPFSFDYVFFPFLQIINLNNSSLCEHSIALHVATVARSFFIARSLLCLGCLKKWSCFGSDKTEYRFTITLSG